MWLHDRENLGKGYDNMLGTLFQKGASLSFQNNNNDLTAIVGKSQKGFNRRLCEGKFVGFRTTPPNFLLSQKTQKKTLQDTQWHYAQGSHKPLEIYLKHWKAWAYVGLPSQVHSIADIARSLVGKGISSRENAKFTEITKPAKYPCVLLAEQP